MRQLKLSKTLRLSGELVKFLRHMNGPFAVDFNKHEADFEVGSFFTIENGRVTFLPDGKEKGLKVAECWVSKKRQEIKIGKLIVELTLRGFLYVYYVGFGPVPANATQLNSFIELASARLGALRIDEQVELRKDVQAVYNLPLRDNSCCASCMSSVSSSGCRFGKWLYERIGAKIACMIDSEGFLGARALVWDVKTKDGKKYTILDRKYGDEARRECLRQWALKQGYYVKEQDTFAFDVTFVNAKGDRIGDRDNPIFINFKPFKTDTTKRVPYMDSLPFISLRKGLGSSQPVDGDFLTLHDSSGSPTMYFRCKTCEAVMPTGCKSFDEVNCRSCVRFLQRPIRVASDLF